jgi:hypothetical protein
MHSADFSWYKGVVPKNSVWGVGAACKKAVQLWVSAAREGVLACDGVPAQDLACIMPPVRIPKVAFPQCCLEGEVGEYSIVWLLLA